MILLSPSSYHASDGAAYERFLGRWTERLAKIFADFARPPADGPVVDVGCGTGSLAAELARRIPSRSAVGVDVAEPYIAYAKQHRATANLRFERADAAALPYPDATFTASLAQLVLTFVPDPRRVVAEMARVTRPGGVIAAAVRDFCGGLVYQRIFWDTAAALDSSAGIARERLFSHPLSAPGGLRALWQSIGLVDIEVGSLTMRMEYANFEDYWVPLQGGQGPVGAFVKGLGGDRRARVEAAVRKAFLCGLPEGPRSLTATAWAVRGSSVQT